MNPNPAGSSAQPKRDDCSICLESLPIEYHKSVCMTCCGNKIHKTCYNDLRASKHLSRHQKNSCVLCRAKHPTTVDDVLKNVRQWAEKGKAWAQSQLGHHYEFGKGVDQSYKRAKELYKRAAGQGDANAQNSIGDLYTNGNDVDQSYEQANKYYEMAARQGHSSAQFELGQSFYYGNGVDVAYEKANEFWTMAAEQGHVTAQYHLGESFYYGIGVDVSYEKAKEFYERAANQNDANAQCMLGHLYILGQGVDQSNDKAREWWSKAAKQGDETSIDNLKTLGRMKKTKPNAKCPCGSGKKYKKCCRRLCL